MAELNAKIINKVLNEAEYEENKGVVLSKGQMVFIVYDDIVELRLGDGVSELENLENLIPTMLSQLSEDTDHQLVSESEKEKWNNKQDKLTIDDKATKGSTNPIQSNAVYELEVEVDKKADTTTLEEYYATIKYVDDLIGGITSIKIVVVNELPEVGEAGTIYLVKHSHGSTDDYDEYIYVEDTGTWEKIGNTDIDLSDYTTLDVFNELKNYVYDTLLPMVDAKIDADKLADVATSGKAADLATDDDHQLVNASEKEEWSGKQDKLIFDTTPVESSTNAITSGAVYTAIEGVKNTISELEKNLEEEIEAATKDVVKYTDEDIVIVETL